MCDYERGSVSGSRRRRWVGTASPPGRSYSTTSACPAKTGPSIAHAALHSHSHSHRSQSCVSVYVVVRLGPQGHGFKMAMNGLDGERRRGAGTVPAMLTVRASLRRAAVHRSLLGRGGAGVSGDRDQVRQGALTRPLLCAAEAECLGVPMFLSGAQAVRQEHRGAAGHAVQARRHGRQDNLLQAGLEVP